LETVSNINMERPALGTGRILVVDDDARNLKLLDAILTAEGHSPIGVQNGEEALRVAREMKPDLILLDIMMPGVDGYEILTELKNAPETMDIPIVMVTSLHDQESRVRALDMGADDFITKPISKPELVARVRSLLKVKAYYDYIRDRRQILEEEVARKTDKLKRYSTQLEIINQASVMINSVLDMPSILRSVAQAALELWPSDGGAAGIVNGGELLFNEWYWKGEHRAEPFRCDILSKLDDMSKFMEVLECETEKSGGCKFSELTGAKIDECLAVPVYDRQLKVQACLLLFNPDNSFTGSTVIDHPLPGLISSAATALDNTRNLTELKEKEDALQSSLKDKDLLLKEIHHRVKNNLQAIVGLMEAHLGTVQDPKDRQVFLKSQSVAMAMAMIHEILYSTEDYAKVDFSEFTDRLVQSSLNLYPEIRDRVQITVDVEEMFLNSDTAVPVSLIINELVSNALTHAFPDNRKGTISILMKQVGKGGYVLEVADDGVGIADSDNDTERQALGLNLIQSLIENLNGSMKMKVNGGTRITLRFKEYFECQDLELG
jgi:two-component sensor histidine kinase/CheY-like chemotaxis protein